MTLHMMRRMAYWPTMTADVASWVAACLECKKHRGRVVQPQLRFTMADDARAKDFPWQDVIADVQGPFCRAEGGEMFILSYMCTKLKVPFLRAFPKLQQGYFSRALVDCILSSRVIPQVLRSDRGQEFMARIM